MREKTQSAIDKAWRDLEKLTAKWDIEGYTDDETQDPLPYSIIRSLP